MSVQCTNIMSYIGAIDKIMLANGHRYACVGGLPTAALLDARTSISANSKVIRVSSDLATPLLRDNGTIRDIDIILFTDSGKTVRDVLKKSALR